MLLLICAALADTPAKLPPDTERGEARYRDNCWQCHGANALGDGPVADALPSPSLAGRISKDAFPDTIALIQGGQGSMPAYSQILDRHDVRRILLWLETLDPQTGLPPGGAPDSEDDAPSDEDAGPDEAPGPGAEPVEVVPSPSEVPADD